MWTGLVTAASIVFLLTHRSALMAGVAALGHIRPLPLALATAATVAAAVNRGAIGRSAHRTCGLDPPLGPMIRTANGAYALNKVLRSGGAAGAVLFVRHGRVQGREPGRVVAASVIAALTAQLALMVTVTGAVVALAVSGRFNPVWALAATGFAAITAGGLGGAIWTMRRPHLMRAGYARAVALRSRLTRRSAEHHQALPDDEFENFHAALREVPHRSASLVALVLHSLAAKLLGAAVLAASMVAAGTALDVRLAVIVYALALMAATASLLPGGVGPVEASMGALLVAQGVPGAAALAVVVTFRFFDLWLPVAAGLLAVRVPVLRPTRRWRTFAHRRIGAEQPVASASSVSSMFRPSRALPAAAID